MVFIMSDIRYGVPYAQTIIDDDVDFKYRWFTTMDDADAYARTLDVLWDASRFIVQCPVGDIDD